LRSAANQDQGTSSATQIKPTFFSEHPIGLGHRVVVYGKIYCEAPDGRQPLTRRELSGDKERPNLIGNLPIHRNGRSTIDQNASSRTHLSIVWRH
jgi:hypothetical protein